MSRVGEGINYVIKFDLFDLFISSLSQQGFSEEGCHVVTSKSNSEETFCSCRHLSHFTVLVDYSGYSPLVIVIVIVIAFSIFLPTLAISPLV